MALEAGKPLSIETIEVQPPKAGEVRVKVSTCVYTAYTNSSVWVIHVGDVATFSSAVMRERRGAQCVTAEDFC